MTWQKKTSAPATFSLKNAMAAMIAGTEANWLTDWMFWIPDALFDTAAFCAEGPPQDVEGFTLSDLLSIASKGKSPITWALLVADLMPKLQLVADDRVFGAYCENVTITPANSGCVTLYDNAVVRSDKYLIDLYPAAIKPMPNAGLLKFTTLVSAIDLHIQLFNGSTFVREGGAGVTTSTQGIGAVSTVTLPQTGITHWAAYTNTAAARWKIEACNIPQTTTTTGHTPLAVPEPTGAPDPLTYNTYATIADLGRELDRQEAKLDQVVAALRYISAYMVMETGESGTNDPIDTDTKIAIGTAYAARITVTGIPNAVSNIAEDPVYWRNLGHFTTWTKEGPLGAEDINHSPQVVIFDPRVTHISVSPMAPAAAYMQLLYPTK